MSGLILDPIFRLIFGLIFGFDLGHGGFVEVSGSSVSVLSSVVSSAVVSPPSSSPPPHAAATIVKASRTANSLASRARVERDVIGFPLGSWSRAHPPGVTRVTVV